MTKFTFYNKSDEELSREELVEIIVFLLEKQQRAVDVLSGQSREGKSLEDRLADIQATLRLHENVKGLQG